MDTTRRKLLASLATILASLKYSGHLHAQALHGAAPRLTGAWQVTSALNSLVLSLEPDGQALVILLEKGSFSAGRTKWKPLPGGLLVGEAILRFRLWEANETDRLRAEMELPEGIETSEGWRTFPRSFFMSRIVQAPKELIDRPLPPGWVGER